METQTMVIMPTTNGTNDRLQELKAFDETKSGVKGLVDAGITKLPDIFIQPSEHAARNSPVEDNSHQHTIPVVDLLGLNGDDGVRHRKIVEEIREAAASWGFFHVMNHGIPLEDLAEMIAGVRRFFEQDNEVKKQYYTRDPSRRILYYSNFNLYKCSVTAWSDSINCILSPDPPAPEALPEAFREIMMSYSKKSWELGCSMLKVLAEALGLNPDRLLELECAKGFSCNCNYYPPCPEPDLTVGLQNHSDKTFITVLLKDSIDGLQIMHQGNWLNVPPVPGAMLINIGDLLQMLSNDIYKSVEHRVTANRASTPRVSIATFFGTGPLQNPRVYEPLEELISDENPPKYRAFTETGYAESFVINGLHDSSALLPFKR